jgi:CrcB protein
VSPLTLALVALGSAIGGVLRYLISFAGEWWLPASLGAPGATIATTVINITGSFAIGMTYGLTDGAIARHFVAVGILGGYTTFSSFSMQTLNLINDGRIVAASVNVIASVVLSLLAVWAGYTLAQAVRRTT